MLHAKEHKLGMVSDLQPFRVGNLKTHPSKPYHFLILRIAPLICNDDDCHWLTVSLNKNESECPYIKNKRKSLISYILLGVFNSSTMSSKCIHRLSHHNRSPCSAYIPILDSLDLSSVYKEILLGVEPRKFFIQLFQVSFHASNWWGRLSIHREGNTNLDTDVLLFGKNSRGSYSYFYLVLRNMKFWNVWFKYWNSGKIMIPMRFKGCILEY